MFFVTRRLQAGLPMCWLSAGLLDSLLLLALPSAVLLVWLVFRHARIIGLVGFAPWASVGFARHVMVDDLMRLGLQVALSPFWYLGGGAIAASL